MFLDRQTDYRIFYKIETFQDCFLVPGIYVIPNFVKIVRVVPTIYKSWFTDTQTDKQPDFLQGVDLSRSTSRSRNICTIKFCENR